MLNTLVTNIPHFLLKEKNHEIGPEISGLKSGVKYSSIYGFSDKSHYDIFCANSQQELIPYPLVDIYLQNEIETQNGVIKLVVIDAEAPRETYIHAATLEAALEAHTDQSTQMTTNYRLKYDREANSYKIDNHS